MMYHKCFYKYIIETSNPFATRPRYSRICAHIEKTCQNFAEVKTPERNGSGSGVPLTEMSPDSSYGECVFDNFITV